MAIKEAILLLDAYLDGIPLLRFKAVLHLDNSLKYGENIHVQLTKTSGQILVIIDDDGPGIEKKEYENVFRPFYKINKGRGDSKSSVGLGMSIASDIVRSHGGNIILDNSPLKGLRVKIFLPF